MAGDHAIMRYGDTKDVGQALGKFQQLQLSNQDFLSVSFTWRYFGKANLSCNQRSACFVLLESAIKVKSCQVRCCYKCFTTEISPTNCLSSCEYTLLETVAQCSNTFETAVCAIVSASHFNSPDRETWEALEESGAVKYINHVVQYNSQLLRQTLQRLWASGTAVFGGGRRPLIIKKFKRKPGDQTTGCNYLHNSSRRYTVKCWGCKLCMTRQRFSVTVLSAAICPMLATHFLLRWTECKHGTPEDQASRDAMAIIMLDIFTKTINSDEVCTNEGFEILVTEFDRFVKCRLVGLNEYYLKNVSWLQFFDLFDCTGVL
jgi:hypothetical protein